MHELRLVDLGLHDTDQLVHDLGNMLAETAALLYAVYEPDYFNIEFKLQVFGEDALAANSEHHWCDDIQMIIEYHDMKRVESLHSLDADFFILESHLRILFNQLQHFR